MSGPRSLTTTSLFVFAAVLLCAPRAWAQSECRAYEQGEEVATLADDRINEASGMAAGRNNPDIFWIHNDSGDSARVFAVDRSGETVTVVELSGAAARDWEDMAIGPCADDDPTPCLYVADIGDNRAVYESVSLIRFPEPTLGDAPPETLTVDAFERIEFTYADGPRDAETLLVHPVDGRIFVIDKTAGDPSNLWRVQWEDQTTATKVGEGFTNEATIFGNRITGGDFSPDGTEFSVRTYGWVHTYCGDDPVAAFGGTPSTVLPVSMKQSESLTYGPASSIWITSEVVEGVPAPLVRLDPVADPTPPMDEATVDSGPDPTDADEDASAIDAGDGRADDDVAAPAPSVSGSSCACSNNRKADSPAEAGLLVLLLLLRFRRRTPSAGSGRSGPSSTCASACPSGTKSASS